MLLRPLRCRAGGRRLRLLHTLHCAIFREPPLRIAAAITPACCATCAATPLRGHDYAIDAIRRRRCRSMLPSAASQSRRRADDGRSVAIEPAAATVSSLDAVIAITPCLNIR